MDDMVGGQVSDLLYPWKSWNTNLLTHLFGAQLAKRILALTIPIQKCPDVRVWRSTCGTRALSKEFYELYEDKPPTRLQAT